MMNPSYGNVPYECNSYFPWPSQNLPDPVNYPQDQSFQYMNNNQNPTFPDPLPFVPLETLESTQYQARQTQEMPFSFQTTQPVSTTKSILVHENSAVVAQVVGEIENGVGSFENGVKELYIGSYECAAQDPYYLIRKKLISPFFPHVEVTGCWPTEQDDVEADVNSTANTRKSRKKKNLFAPITWHLGPASENANPEPPIAKTSKNMKFVLMKQLCSSDVNNLKRIILPKHEAEAHLPALEEKTGIKLLVRDVLLAITWRMKFRFWANSRSRIYVLEHAGDFVKKHELQCGDVIALYRDETDGQIYIYAKKKELRAESSSHQMMIFPPSQLEINTAFPNPTEDQQNQLNVGNPSSEQGVTNSGGISNLLNGTDPSFFNEYGLIPANYNNNNNVPEPSLEQQEGFMNFNAIGGTMFNSANNMINAGNPMLNSTNSLINVEEPMLDSSNNLINVVEPMYDSTNSFINVGETSFAQGGLMNFDGGFEYLNETHQESPLFDETGLSRVDMRPGDQDDYIIFK